MRSVCPKSSNNQIAHSETGFTHTLVASLLNLVKGELYESQESCGETSIPISCVFEKHSQSV